jgi:multiple antibiotic resistance protein
MNVFSSLLSSFVTLFVTIGPIETAVIFAGLTSGNHHRERRSLAFRSVAIAGLMLLLFAVGGDLVLSLLRVSLPAFRVAGGMLLFLQALTLTFSSPGLSSINEVERRDAEKPGDIAVFPLAFPLIASPGALSAVVLLTGRAEGKSEVGSIVTMIGLSLIITYVAMRAADVLVRLLGPTGADVVGRISGVLLAGLAVQFIFDGLRGGFPQAFGLA